MGTSATRTPRAARPAPAGEHERAARLFDDLAADPSICDHGHAMAEAAALILRRLGAAHAARLVTRRRLLRLALRAR